VSFATWEAAIAAGASLDELQKMDRGGYHPAFVAKLIAWHDMSRQIDNHIEDAKSRAIKKGK
jgi:hypothetical protein